MTVKVLAVFERSKRTEQLRRPPAESACCASSASFSSFAKRTELAERLGAFAVFLDGQSQLVCPVSLQEKQRPSACNLSSSSLGSLFLCSCRSVCFLLPSSRGACFSFSLAAGLSFRAWEPIAFSLVSLGVQGCDPEVCVLKRPQVQPGT